jgi:hypothetical protein
MTFEDTYGRLRLEQANSDLNPYVVVVVVVVAAAAAVVKKEI